MNVLLILTFYYINNLNIENIYNLGSTTVLYYKRFCWSVKRKNGTAGSQCSRQKACFARAIQVWLAVN